jgi:Envelope integrity protein A
MTRIVTKLVALLAVMIMPLGMALAQGVRTVDPNAAMAGPVVKASVPSTSDGTLAAQPGVGPIDSPGSVAAPTPGAKSTYKKDDLIGAASGAFVVGLRYGSGTMRHSVEGEKPVYWTGPSIGFDVGGDAAKVFVLVYNLYDSEELYRRYPQAEGRAYFVGGFSGSYLRRGNVAIIPIRLGAGVRLGANVGYMKFSRKSKWLPF